MKTYVIQLFDERETLHLGMQLAQCCIRSKLIIYLYGDLGVGKTTFTRGFLYGLGYKNKIKSPTYTLVESYEVGSRLLHHFDFYRINNPEELELIGICDYFSNNALCIVEWPQQAIGIIPESDLKLKLNYVEIIREVEIKATSDEGKYLVQKFQQYRNKV
ncbi:tRNA (adenosine(37)-N6)-threonylcarbamoyltransferase complex ATPase subunit type 1 TsaE [Pantoea sp. Aalb]|uniref:tRNA (adenosine(37)-N6)-threonylcarbamoyltransferase complex ATPase subunit type 1 TsaE n=1 Tax=Pantoea sp. Aalb TaxID=2576762 RepID=UPI0013227B6B|nr:tRNA (adenosine(37)-N6)-threonylcarbamoyltransferase complex ATPase subunit type 1 TsaE [Pantoea sp. Aalb]MXP67673.1 tRNA (adenosine(37)-N6)-threonylcarbamoyltransferase complex ATPase subunit type 1 TsaE [Pantoea sp. Aalb]